MSAYLSWRSATPARFVAASTRAGTAAPAATGAAVGFRIMEAGDVVADLGRLGDEAAQKLLYILRLAQGLVIVKSLGVERCGGE